MAILTDMQIKRTLKNSKIDQSAGSLNESLGRGEGSLTLRYRNGAGTWFYTYTVIGTKTVKRVRIGQAGENGVPLQEARAKAREFVAQKRLTDNGDLIAHQQAAKEKRNQEEKRAITEAKAQEQRTVERLLRNYISDLNLRKKESTHAVELVFNGLLRDFPLLGCRDATTVDAEEWADILRKYGEVDGHATKMRKVRAYVHAAYKMAMSAGLDPMKPKKASMRISVNPIAAIPAPGTKARRRALSEAEFRTLWAHIKADTSSMSPIMQAVVLLGGQRFTQMTRARLNDYHDGQLVLWDPKGKREEPRRHPLPVLGETAQLLNVMAQRAKQSGTEFLFTRAGAKPPGAADASQYINKLSKQMFAAGKVAELFKAGAIRSTIETILGERLKISKDARAQLLSHGLSGVQDRHYDAGEHMDTKAEALAKWEHWLAQDVRKEAT